MLITFIDESSRAASEDGEDIYFIGALTVDTRALVEIEQELDRVVRDAASSWPPLGRHAELHGYDLFHGENEWRGVPARLRAGVSRSAMRIIADASPSFVVRGTGIQSLEARYSTPHPVHELTLAHALEETERQLASRGPSHERILVVADEHHTAEDGRRRFRSIREEGGGGFTREPLLRFVDTIYFGPSNHSRLLQAADMSTYFWNRSLTVRERDSRAEALMVEIRADLDRFTDDCFIWYPSRRS